MSSLAKGLTLGDIFMHATDDTNNEEFLKRHTVDRKPTNYHQNVDNDDRVNKDSTVTV